MPPYCTRGHILKFYGHNFNKIFSNTLLPLCDTSLDSPLTTLILCTTFSSNLPPPPWSKFSNFFWPHVIYYCTTLWHLFPVLNFTSLLCSISLPCGTFLTFSNLPYVIYHWTALRTSLLYYASFVPLPQLASSGLFSLIRVPTRLTNICIDKLNNGVSFGYIFV